MQNKKLSILRHFGPKIRSSRIVYEFKTVLDSFEKFVKKYFGRKFLEILFCFKQAGPGVEIRPQGSNLDPSPI